MITQTEKAKATAARASSWRARVWRYGPLVVWMCFIFFASTNQLSASNTSLILRPLLIWLIPSISEDQLALAHFVVRKLAHFAEYAVLGLLAARAYRDSSRPFLRAHWFLFALLLVILYALSDELHQYFVPSRTGSIYDSLIDMAGGLTAISLLALRRRRKRREIRD